MYNSLLAILVGLALGEFSRIEGEGKADYQDGFGTPQLQRPRFVFREGRRKEQGGSGRGDHMKLMQLTNNLQRRIHKLTPQAFQP